jgi:hypothetical protein
MTKQDDMFPRFFKSIFSSGLDRMDDPTRNVALVYAQDLKFFAQNRNKKRSMYIRRAWQGEFGIEMSSLANGPPLFVWVKKFATGIHEVSVCYVGEWIVSQNLSTDYEVLQIILEMCRLGGMDRAVLREFMESLDRYLEASLRARLATDDTRK